MKPLDKIKELESELKRLQNQIQEIAFKKSKLIKTITIDESYSVLDRFEVWRIYGDEKINRWLPSESEFPYLRGFMNRSGDMEDIGMNRRSQFDLFDGGDEGISGLLYEILHPEDALKWQQENGEESLVDKYFKDDQQGLDNLLREIMTTGITGFVIDW